MPSLGLTTLLPLGFEGDSTTPGSALLPYEADVTTPAPTIPEDWIIPTLANDAAFTNSTDDFPTIGPPTVGVYLLAVLVLLVGVAGNVVLLLVFLWRPLGRPPLAVDRVLGLLALTGLITALTASPMHLYTFSYMSFPGSASLCQVLGFLLNLLCLLSLWFTAVLAVERHVKFACPHEHLLTFSVLNLNVILAGVLVLLLIEVSGPIYGWAQYGFVRDCTACIIDPESTHIFTYAVIQTSCYVMLPAAFTLFSSGAVLWRAKTRPAVLCRGSQVLKSSVGVMVLCLSMVLTVLFLLPYHILLLLQAAEVDVPVSSKVWSYWLHLVGLTCVYPCILLLARPKEVWPAVISAFGRLRKLRQLRKCPEDGGGIGGRNYELTQSLTQVSSSRRISMTSHMTDTTCVSSNSPTHHSGSGGASVTFANTNVSSTTKATTTVATGVRGGQTTSDSRYVLNTSNSPTHHSGSGGASVTFANTNVSSTTKATTTVATGVRGGQTTSDSRL